MDIKVTALDTKVGQMDTRVNKVEVQSNRLASRIEQLQLAARKSEIAQIISEENSRKYNISIGNVHMKKEYEDKETSIENVQSILNTVLKIPDAHKIIIRDAHRLPTRKQGERKPLIFKLSTMIDKNKIWEYLPNLAAHNEGRDFEEKIFIDMNNLPAKLARDKAELLNDYKIARTQGHKPKWRFVKDIRKNVCDYCYVIGGKYYHPKNDNYNFKLTDNVHCKDDTIIDENDM